MADQFLGQVFMAGFNFAPLNCALANGQLMPITQYQALFALLGTQFGGNGTTNFALPDLRSRTPIGYASSVDPSWQPPAVQIGQAAGVESVTLLSTNLPSHSHQLNATTSNGTTRNPSNAIYANTAASLFAASNGPLVPLDPSTVSPSGGNQPHPNIQPYSVINFCIALSGIFPSRN